jgi:hypothetical protein
MPPEAFRKEVAALCTEIDYGAFRVQLSPQPWERDATIGNDKDSPFVCRVHYAVRGARSYAPEQRTIEDALEDHVRRTLTGNYHFDLDFKRATVHSGALLEGTVVIRYWGE